jgi:hypothetical protein
LFTHARHIFIIRPCYSSSHSAATMFTAQSIQLGINDIVQCSQSTLSKLGRLPAPQPGPARRRCWRSTSCEISRRPQVSLCTFVPLEDCRRFETGGSLDRRVNCRRVPQPRWVGARRSAKGGRQPEGDGRERWKSRGVRVCPAPGSGALAVGGYKRPRGRERAASRERLSRPSPRGQPSVRGLWSFLL